VSYVDGTCIGITRRVFHKIGYLDSDFLTSGGWGADIDYCIRAKKENIRIGVIMNTYLDHLGHQTSIRFDQNRSSFNFLFREILKRKYGKDYVKLWYRLH
jgi:GT2 family glycosyltransferase